MTDLSKEELIALITEIVNQRLDPIKNDVQQMADMVSRQLTQLEELHLLVDSLKKQLSSLPD